MNEQIAGEADVESLARLHALCFAKPWDAKAISELLSQPPVYVVAAKDGFVLARATGGEAEILTLAVAPGARRQGLGTALVRAAAERAQQLQADRMFLEVDQNDPAARALYEKLGFSPVGLRKSYYNTGADALVLRAALPLSDLGKTG